MAKKKKHDSKTDADLDIDMDELEGLGDDFNFGDEDGIDDDNRKPSRSKVVTDLAKEAGESALESVIKNSAKKALPDEYSANYTDAVDIATFTSEVLDKNKQSLNKSAFRLGKEVKKILPFKIGLLDKYLESQQSQFESFQTQTEEQLRSAGVASETASIFDKQLDVQKSLYARTEAQNDVDKRQKLVQDKLSNEVLANMDGNIAHQTAFTTQISKEYYKRSLELQFKSYYVQADSLRTMREYYKAFTIQFTNIEKNTGLPDFVKLRNTEKLQDMLREQSVQSVYTNLIGNSKYLASMKKKMSGYVEEKVDKVKNSMDDATGMLEMVNSSAEGGGGSGMSILASIIAAMGGQTLGEKVAKYTPEGLKNNKSVKIGANYMSMLGNSPSSLLEAGKRGSEKLRDSASDESTPGQWIQSKLFGGLNSLLDAGTPGGETQEITNDGYLTHNQPAIFDKKIHRSISEAIPLYLARILQTNSDLTSMYAQMHPGAKRVSELLVYDYESRKLTTQGEVASNIVSKLFKEKAVAPKAKLISKSILSDAQTAVNKTDKSKSEKSKINKTLDSKEGNAKLTAYIEEAVKNTEGKVDFATLFENYESNEALKNIVDKDEVLEELIKNIKEHKPTSIANNDNRLKDINRNYPLESVKILFLKVAEFSGRKNVSDIDDVTAESFSKIFTGYVLSTGKDVVPSTVVDRSVFKDRVLEKDFTKEFQKALNDIIFDLRNIDNFADTLITTSVENLFSLMNKSLREGQDITSETFKSLRDLDPNIVGSGKLDVSNYREGSLSVGKDNKYVDVTSLLEISGVRKLDPKTNNDKPPEPNFVDNIINRGKETVKSGVDFVIENKNDPSAGLDKIWENIKNKKTSIAGKLSQQKANLQKDIANFFKEHKLDPKSIREGGLIKLISKYDTMISRLQGLVDLMEAETQERLQLINQAVSEASELTKGQETDLTEKKIGSVTSLYQKGTAKSVDLLKSTIETLKTQRSEMQLIKNDGNSAIKNQLSRVKEAIIKGLTSIEGAMEEYEKAGKDVMSNLN